MWAFKYGPLIWAFNIGLYVGLILIYFLLKNMDKRNLNRYNIINTLKNIYGTDFL